MARRSKAQEKQRIESIFSKLAETIVPKSDLEFSGSFELLVAVILSAQSTDKQVNKATRPLFKKANTPKAIQALGVEGLTEEIRSIGLFRNKAKNIHKTCRLLITDHDGQVPSNRADLEALPGVGKKTAGVVLNVGFGQPTIPVDTHVFRLSHRLGMARAKTPDKTEDELLKIVPEAYRQSAHHLLILHGRYVCKSRTPLCQQCDIAEYCYSKDKITAADLAKARTRVAKKRKKKSPAKKAPSRAKPSQKT
jgi:endonuclease III